MDRAKVIKGLEWILEGDRFGFGKGVTKPETDEEKAGCFIHDALALLKEQEAVKPKSKVRHGANAQIQHFCGNCNSMLHGKPKYCSECGKGVSW